MAANIPGIISDAANPSIGLTTYLVLGDQLPKNIILQEQRNLGLLVFPCNSGNKPQYIVRY